MSKEIMKDSVIKGNAAAAKSEAEKALRAGMKATEALSGLVAGMNTIAKQFEDAMIYLPQVMVAADAMIAGINVLEPELAKAGKTAKLGKVVIGTVQGDIHDIGKTICAIMLRGAGFDIYDLGRDVKIELYWEKVKEVDANIVAVSALMSTTTLFQRNVVEAGKEEGLYPKVKVLVGGACATPEWAEEIGAVFGANASEAVYRAKEMVE
ncbi:MAG: cobalamin B12-binding domain-containing protein [archaeon]|nr:cobalamin B12-binding domain-containing protein [archaeon]MCP8306052.1 cobalamin B12-binding domain-containing protein [archaeon]